MKDHYTISEFYLMLKLGLFRNGKVGNWGYLSVNRELLCLGKPPEEYRGQLYAKKQLGTGLYLLDLYLLEKGGNNRRVYMMVIAVCRTTLRHKEKIYVLKLTGIHNVAEIEEAVGSGSLSRKRKSVLRRKPGKAAFDSSPLNSVPRKH